MNYFKNHIFQQNKAGRLPSPPSASATSLAPRVCSRDHIGWFHTIWGYPNSWMVCFMENPIEKG